MCEPTIIAASLGGVGQLIGTGLSIGGQLGAAGEAQRVANANAAQAEKEAGIIRSRGAREAREIEREGHRMAGTAQVAAAASGVRGGTIDNIFAVNQALAAADAAVLRQQAEEAAQAREFEAGELRRSGAFSAHAGLLGAVGTGISGFGSVASSIIGAVPGGASAPTPSRSSLGLKVPALSF